MNDKLEKVREIDVAALGLTHDSDFGASFHFLPDLDHDNVLEIAVGAPLAPNFSGSAETGQVVHRLWQDDLRRLEVRQLLGQECGRSRQDGGPEGC